MTFEPSEIKEYSSTRSFHLQDADWGASAIALHSFGSSYIGDAIDLIFLNTEYIELPFEMNGIKITLPSDNTALEYEQQFGVHRSSGKKEGERVFNIASSGKNFHVIAAKLWILTRTHNDMKALPRLLSKDDSERTSFLQNHVKEWYKITLYPE